MVRRARERRDRSPEQVWTPSIAPSRPREADTADTHSKHEYDPSAVSSLASEARAHERPTGAKKVAIQYERRSL
jgi:hypothetical protein